MERKAIPWFVQKFQPEAQWSYLWKVYDSSANSGKYSLSLNELKEWTQVDAFNCW